MTREEIQQALNEKLDRGFDVYRAEMLGKDADILFESADEIHYAQQVYDELYNSTHHTSALKYLLRFEDPFTVMRDQWAQHNNVSIRDDFSFALWELSGREEYALDEKYLPSEPEQEQQM